MVYGVPTFSDEGQELAEATEYLRPQAPHDDLSFEELAARYNYDMTSYRGRLLVRLLIQEARKRQRPVRMLDIGSGYGIGDNCREAVLLLRALRPHVDELWGVEPDPQVRPAHSLFDQTRTATMESADLPAGYFDVAFSSFVMEHVDDPKSFLAAVRRCLKPGGAYLFVTPNARHYFTRTARLLAALHLDEWVLRLVRGKVVDQYHYRVRYRCNSPKQIDRYAAETGFLPPEYAYTETGGPRPYFPGPLILPYRALVLKRKIYHRPEQLLELFCRMTVPGGGAGGDGDSPAGSQAQLLPSDS